ncbi:MAG: hypothetical protein WCF19_05350 [Chlamydiales bacterium]
MELERLREIIEKTKSFKTNPACMELAEHFEAMAQLYYEQKEGTVNGDYFERFGSRCQQFWASFDRVVESLGYSPEVLKSNLNNKDFFHPDQWRAMQAVKCEITGEKPVEAEPKRSKRRNKNVRI